MKKLLKNERGSAIIEFVSMVPLVLLLMMILWQFLVAGYAVIITQSAANEAAKVYSVTKDSTEAKHAAEKIINSAKATLKLSGDNVINSSGSRNFEAKVKVDMTLKFLPKKFLGAVPPITFEKSISGRTVE
ncbi:TadE family protein [Cytobacillus dafuensis]|uniref:Pilus assembly protein n=1 Tax=Cytobacillus dafuensis TaxID=1742359 RepID=A0A5B8Z0K2_CYTDA|nr:TadE family protein [Cytobacillus dafuensis]QED46418.1 pilus assembly protein [Cytobacillus dafuensis]